MAFDWYVPNPKPQWEKSGIDILCETLNFIRKNDRESLKLALESAQVDCDSRILITGSSWALIMIAVHNNNYDCGAYKHPKNFNLFQDVLADRQNYVTHFHI